MSYYGVIFPEFWTGRTGKELRERGGKDAQLLALYLFSNRHMNMLGLYRLQVDDVKHETGLGPKAIARAYAATAESDFATFDARSAYVWVHQMARFRLGLKPGDGLKVGDNRVESCNRIYHALHQNPFLAKFYETYRRVLHLKTAREAQGVVVPYEISSPSGGASKGLTSQITETEIRDQEIQQRSEGPQEERAATRPAFERYHEHFQTKYHNKPTYAGGKDGARMKRLVKAIGIEETLERLDAFFASMDAWVQRSGHTLDVFFAAGTQTKLAAEVGRRRQQAAVCPHDPPCLNPGRHECQQRSALGEARWQQLHPERYARKAVS